MATRKKIDWQTIEIIFLIIVLVTFVFGYSSIEGWVYSVWPTKYSNVGTYNLPKMTLQFVQVAFFACMASTIVGVGIGLFCFSEIGKSFRPIIEKLATITQSIPTMAILLFVIGIFGFGMIPAVCALILQGVLPIIFATIAGIENISKSYIDVASGLGMSRGQILKKVEIPMALPIILSGIRTSLIICIGAATLAFNTGAGGLGLIIYTGYSTYNTIFILEGTIPICLLAILADRVLRKLESNFYRIQSN